MVMQRILFHTGAWLIVLSVTGCDEPVPTKRVYQEVVQPAPVTAVPADAIHAGMSDMTRPIPVATEAAAFEWVTPTGWREEAGTGMRTATLWIEDAECTLIVLTGDMGGMAANVARWLEQVQLPVPAAAELEAYVEALPRFTTAGGGSGVLIDFDEWVFADDARSTLAGVISLEQGQTLFVKLTGPAALLRREKMNFIELCESIR
jgi:hypothetical protein